MKQIIIITATAILGLAAYHANAQEPEFIKESDTSILKVLYKTEVLQYHQPTKKGWLAGLTDSTIEMSDAKVRFSPYSDAARKYNQLGVRNVDKVRVWKKGRVARYVLLGAIGGAIIGTITGLAFEHKPKPTTSGQSGYNFFGYDFSYYGNMEVSSDFSAAAGGAIGIFGGAAIGAIVGVLAKKTFVIHGKSEKMAAMRQSMEKKVYDINTVYRTKN